MPIVHRGLRFHLASKYASLATTYYSRNNSDFQNVVGYALLSRFYGSYASQIEVAPLKCGPALNTMHSSGSATRTGVDTGRTRQTTRSNRRHSRPPAPWAQLILSVPPKTGRRRRTLILGKSLRRSMGESAREGLYRIRRRGDKLRSDSYVVPPLPPPPFKDGGNKQ